MIVGFSAYGTGSAKAAVTYLTSPTNVDGSQRTPAPVVLQGNPEFVSKLIDALPFAKTYKSGVLSFAEGEDMVTPNMQREIMAEFERVAFAGMGTRRIQHFMGKAHAYRQSGIKLPDSARAFAHG